MKQNLMYLILPTFQAAGSVIILLLIKYHLPAEMSVYMAIGILALLAFSILVFRLLWILISSYIINISKIFFYKVEKEDIISICLYPLFFYKQKRKIANVFWVYDDRTYFSINKYLKNKSLFEEFRQMIQKRNRILAGIYIVCSVVVILGCLINRWYVVSWIVFIGAIEHFFYQWEYKTIGSANAMSFSGLRYVNNRLLLHILVNQSKMEELDIGDDVAEIISKDMYDRDGGYFFNYLCLSSMFSEISRMNQGNQKYPLHKYMNEKVNNIIENHCSVMSLVQYTDNHPLYKNIEKNVCLFYDHYREFLLYVLMYYKLIQDSVRYEKLNRYIEAMLKLVEKNYVHDSALSKFVLLNKFYEYQELYFNVLKGDYSAETSIFTGYDTLPFWKEQRKQFLSKYNKLIDEQINVEV